MTGPLPSWDALVARAEAIGYRVELVEYCESADSPGLLGAALGVCVYARKVIRVREQLRPDDREFVLAHELEHAEGDVGGAGRDFHSQLDRDFHLDADNHARHLSIAAYLYPVR